MSGSSNLLIVEAADEGRQMMFQVMPALGSRRFDLLPERMSREVEDVFFSSSKTVAFLCQEKLMHFHLNSSPQVQDDPEVKKVSAECMAILYESQGRDTKDVLIYCAGGLYAMLRYDSSGQAKVVK